MLRYVALIAALGSFVPVVLAADSPQKPKRRSAEARKRIDDLVRDLQKDCVTEIIFRYRKSHDEFLEGDALQARIKKNNEIAKQFVKKKVVPILRRHVTAFVDQTPPGIFQRIDSLGNKQELSKDEQKDLLDYTKELDRVIEAVLRDVPESKVPPLD
jgi:hypothetical protein